ncbi:MAG: hypothetical protein KDD22_00850 [Bdellovibrionales bacterium]|nr:hypothetical protein [Bdellovibrionales bacterium]
MKKYLLLLAVLALPFSTKAKPANYDLECRGPYYSSLGLTVYEMLPNENDRNPLILTKGGFSSVFGSISLSEDEYEVRRVRLESGSIAYRLSSPHRGETFVVYRESVDVILSEDERIPLACSRNTFPF